MNNSQFLDFCESIQPSQTTDRLARGADNAAIHDALTASGLKTMPYSKVREMVEGFVYLSVIDANNASRYEDCGYILNKVRQYFNNSTTKVIADWSEKVWSDVITFIKQQPESFRRNGLTLEESYLKQYERAKAAQRLTVYGVSAKVEDCELVVSDYDGVKLHINKLAQKIGGRKGLELMLSELPFDKEIHRYIVPRTGNTLSLSHVVPDTPYGYLNNLLIKYLATECDSLNPEKDYQDLKAVATDLCVSVYDSQKYDIWTDVFMPQTDFIQFLNNMIIRHDIYTLPQTSASFTMVWCDYMCQQIRRNAKCTPSLCQWVNDFAHALNHVKQLAKMDRCVTVPLKSKEGKQLSKLFSSLSEYLVKDATELNVDFSLPDDYNKVNYMKFPVYKTDEDYIMLPTTLGLWSWYEALQAILRKESNNAIYPEIGIMIEDFLRKKLQSHGILLHTGEYEYTYKLKKQTPQGEEEEEIVAKGETDVLVEATEGDALIECKKRSFSLNALSVNVFSIWDDIRDLLKSQMQCAKAENGVRNSSPLNLKDKSGNTYPYTWKPTYEKDTDRGTVNKERFIAKVSLTLKEYGPIQDKLLISRFITSILGKAIKFDLTNPQISERDKKNMKKVEEDVNDTIEEMTKYYISIGTANPTFHCRFYNMEQLYHLIRTSRDNDDFVRRLAQDYASTGTYDFWNELVIARRLGRK